MEDLCLISLGKFAELTKTPVKTLIHYDQKGVLKPHVRTESGRRSYTYQQVVMVKLINILKNCGMQLSEISQYTKKREPEQIMELLKQKGFELREQMQKVMIDYQETDQMMQLYVEMTRKGLSKENNEIEIAYEGGVGYDLGSPCFFEDGVSFNEAYKKHCDEYFYAGGNLNYPVGGWWSSFESYCQNSDQPDRLFSFNPSGNQSSPAGKYLIGYAKTHYHNADHGLPERMAAYAKEHKLNLDGPAFCLYLLNYLNTDDPQRYIMQVSVMLI